MNCLNGLIILVSAITAPESNFESGSLAKSSQIQYSSRSLDADLEFALNQIESTALQNWSYRVSRYENEEGTVSSSLESFDPRRQFDDRWQLEQINDQPPTAKQQQDFKTRKVKAAKNEDSKSVSIRLRDLIQADTLQWTFEDTTTVHGQFDVFLARLGEDASKKLTGKLKLNKEHGHIETLTVTNSEAFSPMFSANITDFTLSFRFEKHSDAVLLVEQNLAMQGTFAWVTQINEVSKDRFFDYQDLSDGVKPSQSTP